MIIMYVHNGVCKNNLENNCLNLYDIVSLPNEGWLHLHELRKLFTKQLKLIKYDWTFSKMCSHSR